MKKIFFVLLIFSLFCVSFVYADISYHEENYSRTLNTDSSFVEVTKLRYEPYPVSPGDYFTIYIQAQKTGAMNTNVKFELLPEYPFSLDSNENPIRTFTNLNNEPVVFEYKVRVDPSAVSGENTLKLRQNGSGSSVINEFDINVQDVQTSFDAVVQDSSSGEVSVALANVGQNDAGAVIVRVPDQEGIRVSGTNGQMVGNLDQGDYTIVGFTVSGVSKTLKMEVDYTDAIGVRRSEIVEMPFSGGNSFASNSSETFSSARGRFAQQQTSSSGTSWTTWLVLVFVVVALVFVWNKYFRRRGHSKEAGSRVPVWIEKVKGSKKK